MAPFRTTILLHSTLTGAILGVVAGAVLFALGVALWMLLPEPAARLVARARIAATILCFVLIPLAGAILGWLEGRLKL